LVSPHNFQVEVWRTFTNLYFGDIRYGKAPHNLI
jgi:hypothetical protein